MRRIERIAQRTYGRHLGSTEKVQGTAEATAGGTGRIIGTGLLIGALSGLLYAVIVDATPLPSIALGSFAGIIGGYVAAARHARRKDGPGATQVRIVLTDERLLIIPLRAATRTKPLRSFPLAQVTAIHSEPTPIGRYRSAEIRFSDREPIRLMLSEALELPLPHREQSNHKGVD
jgi:hypothetical protein